MRTQEWAKEQIHKTTRRFLWWAQTTYDRGTFPISWVNAKFEYELPFWSLPVLWYPTSGSMNCQCRIQYLFSWRPSACSPLQKPFSWDRLEERFILLLEFTRLLISWVILIPNGACQALSCRIHSLLRTFWFPKLLRLRLQTRLWQCCTKTWLKSFLNRPISLDFTCLAVLIKYQTAAGHCLACSCTKSWILGSKSNSSAHSNTVTIF